MKKKSRNILVVDDSKAIVAMVKMNMQSMTLFNIFCAYSFEEAKNLIDEHDFFIAIIDLELPDAHSGEALDYALSKQVPSIVLSGTVNDALRERVINSSLIIDYIAKDNSDSIFYTVELVKSLDFFYGKKVLVVDDSATSRAYISSSFKTLLFDTIECADPLNAMKIIDENDDIKVVTLDYEMPNMDGATLARKIRIAHRDRKMVLVGITATNDEKAKIRFVKNGVNSIFGKPFTREVFTAEISNLMRILEHSEKLADFMDKVDKYVITSVTDVSGIITYVSDAFCKVSGFTKDELIGNTHAIIKHQDSSDKYYENIWKTITGGHSWHGDIKNKNKDGTTYWLDTHIEPIFEQGDEIIGYQSIRTDITDKKTIERMSITDELTQLFNRRYFNTMFTNAILEAREENKNLAFFIMDVDNFKKYNDAYGHHLGDNVLKSIATVLISSLSTDSYSFRLGGEEFGGYFYVKDVKDALETIEMIRSAIFELNIEHKNNTPSLVVTASFGVVVVSPYGQNKTQDELYIAADEALYEAKDSGRNRVCFYDK